MSYLYINVLIDSTLNLEAVIKRRAPPPLPAETAKIALLTTTFGFITLRRISSASKSSVDILSKVSDLLTPRHPTPSSGFQKVGYFT